MTNTELKIVGFLREAQGDINTANNLYDREEWETGDSYENASNANLWRAIAFAVSMFSEIDEHERAAKAAAFDNLLSHYVHGDAVDTFWYHVNELATLDWETFYDGNA